jgi:phage terminase small subunit
VSDFDPVAAAQLDMSQMSPEAIATSAEILTTVEDMPLNARQRAFVAEYVIDLNASRAAIRAGYSSVAANVAGSTLLANRNVANAVEHALASRLARTQITQDTVLNEMAILALARIDHYELDDQGQVRLTANAPEGAMAAVKSIKRRVTFSKQGDKTIEAELVMHDKTAPLKLMGRHVGLFADRVEHTGKDGKPIAIERVERVIVDVKPETEG